MNPARSVIELEVYEPDTMEATYWSLELLPGNAFALPYHAEQFGYWIRQSIRSLKTRDLRLKIVRFNCNIGYSAERGTIAQFNHHNSLDALAFQLPGQVVSLLHSE